MVSCTKMQHELSQIHIQEKLFHNSLVHQIKGVLGHIANYKYRVRDFYFEVLLSIYHCPVCGGRLHMTGQSGCFCSCGNEFDPTIAFQKSTCCQAKLVRKTFHYACSRCNNTVPSRFVFDEKIFDNAYFREMMQECRERKKRKREEIRRLLAESRSSALPLMENPCLDSIPGLIQDLNDFVGEEVVEAFDFHSDMNGCFSLQKYREHILSNLNGGSRMFSDIEVLVEDSRLDKNLETVADPEDELALLDEPLKRLKEVVYDLVGKDLAGSNIVAVAKAARDDDYLELVQHVLVLDYPVYVNTLGLRPRQLQSVFGFDVTVYPCRPQDYRFNFCHL